MRPGPSSPPEGFTLVGSRAPFIDHVGPIYERQTPDGQCQRCFWADRHHTNGLDLVHGGMLAAFLDGALARCVATERLVPVTVSLSLDYLRMARAGEWIFADARMLRSTRDMGFAEGRVQAGGVDAVRGSGVFKLFPR